MKWFIRFFLGESRLLELWNQADENPVVQLFDPARRGRWVKFVHQWLALLLPIVALVVAYLPLYLGHQTRLEEMLGQSTLLLIALSYAGSVVLPIFGMIVLRGRLHDREGLEQLCLTPLTRDGIALGAVYWPIRFTFRALKLLLAIAWVSGIGAITYRSYSGAFLNNWGPTQVLSALLLFGFGGTLFFLSIAFSTIMVTARTALADHTGRWRLIYRVPLRMIPHGVWFIGMAGACLFVISFIEDRIFKVHDYETSRLCASIGAIIVATALIRFQLWHMTRRISDDGPGLYFEVLREQDEPPQDWLKAEWQIWRSRAARKHVLAEVKGNPGRATLFEYLVAVGVALGFVVQTVVIAHGANAGLWPDRFSHYGESNNFLDRFLWMGFGPGAAFIFPLVVWVIWWGVYGRLRNGEGGTLLCREAPLLGAVYAMRQFRLAWVIPLCVMSLCIYLTARYDFFAQFIPANLVWALYIGGGFLLACIAALQMQVSEKPLRIAKMWLTLAFVFLMVDGLRYPSRHSADMAHPRRGLRPRDGRVVRVRDCRPLHPPRRRTRRAPARQSPRLSG
jgi:hypothetical protein